ncbi:hypothetical protein OR606_06680 [Aeromonas hydrophila]|nr:hypothetical protein [Aeromonas hydrophila]MCX4039885.1 hypothetical protein [Aeromonas hydrophila]
MQKFVAINCRSSFSCYISIPCCGIQTTPSRSEKLTHVESTRQQTINQPHLLIPAQQYGKQYLAAGQIVTMPEAPEDCFYHILPAGMAQLIA